MKKSIQRRRDSAQRLLEERAKRSDKEQLALIDKRPGRSEKERARLLRRLEKNG